MLSSLLDAVCRDDAGSVPALADWLRDHPNDVGECVATLLQRLPELLGSHLTLSASKDTEYSSRAEVLNGWSVSVSWDGMELGRTYIPLR